MDAKGCFEREKKKLQGRISFVLEGDARAERKTKLKNSCFAFLEHSWVWGNGKFLLTTL